MVEEKKFYLTKEGLERIKKEYKTLKEMKLAKTRGESPKILHSEDLNPEYLAFQEDISFLESRIIELENIIKNADLIRPPKKEKQNIIDLGATVLVEIDGQTDEFTLVGSLEANPSIGKISDESPVGHALLGHRVGDAVVVSSPIQTIYKIKKIKYHLSPSLRRSEG
ncbi:MAG: GreA/GreB family elongation factor [bacterium]|nr:GreA/GreB family elongation factor [bacterium]